ncbi:MAG: hypothetical protein ABIO70_35100 [Pseudomonadota bacterium]
MMIAVAAIIMSASSTGCPACRSSARIRHVLVCGWQVEVQDRHRRKDEFLGRTVEVRAWHQLSGHTAYGVADPSGLPDEDDVRGMYAWCYEELTEGDLSDLALPREQGTLVAVPREGRELWSTSEEPILTRVVLSASESAQRASSLTPHLQ